MGSVGGGETVGIFGLAQLCYATLVIYLTQTPMNNYNNKLFMTNYFSFSEAAFRSWFGDSRYEACPLHHARGGKRA